MAICVMKPICPVQAGPVALDLTCWDFNDTSIISYLVI